jgi:hypothetical protein
MEENKESRREKNIKGIINKRKEVRFILNIINI